MPAAGRTDDASSVIGDVVYIRTEECDHLILGNPSMAYKVGSHINCWKCSR